MDLRDSPLSGVANLIPKDAVEKTIVKSSRVLRGEAIHKAVTQDKPVRNLNKDCSSCSLQNRRSCLSASAISHPGGLRAEVLLLPLLQVPKLLLPASILNT